MTETTPKPLAEALAARGYDALTPVQQAVLTPEAAGRDLIVSAQTGSGKTVAFGLAVAPEIIGDGGALDPDLSALPRGLIVAPTRELALQVAREFAWLYAATGAAIATCVGGMDFRTERRALERGAGLVVGTPGRLRDHVERGTLKLEGVRAVVLDEADEMLDMGFAEDLEAILAATPAEKQVALFSATLAPRIATIARTHLREPEVIEVDTAAVKAARTATIRQVAYLVARAYKMPALARILDIERPTSAIVFCRTRTEVDALTETLTGRGLPAEALHGGLSQEQRDRVMKRFRAKTSTLLVATDVAARGLDVQHVSHVVNFDVPN
ncbi:MAG: DEAD/DEAH box helicase, partial [Gemmobacter sp.]